MSTINTKPLNQDVLIRCCMGSPEFALSIVQQFLGSCSEELPELSQLLRDRRHEELARAAHRIKGTAAQISAARMASELERIEIQAESGSEVSHDQIENLKTMVDEIREFVRTELEPMVSSGGTSEN